MVSFWFIFSAFLYVISECNAVPLRIAPQESQYLGLDENIRLKRESDLFRQEIQKGRNRREASDSKVPSGCEEGKAYGLALVPHCHRANAKYDAKMKMCLLKLLHVPGMPDGHKGYTYIAINYFLYKVSNATNRYSFVKCPESTTVTPTTKPSTTEKVLLASTTKLKATPTVSVTGTPGSTPIIIATKLATSKNTKLQQTSKSNASEIVPITLIAKYSIKPTATTNLKPTSPVTATVHDSIIVNANR